MPFVRLAVVLLTIDLSAGNPRLSEGNCPEPPSKPHMITDLPKGSISEGTVLVYRCTEAYQFLPGADPPRVICSKLPGGGLGWYDPYKDARCVEVPCPASLAGSPRVKVDISMDGKSARFSCPPQESLTGSDMGSCKAGAWDFPSGQPNCTVNTCDPPAAIPDGTVRVPPGSMNAEYLCNPNFRLVGDNRRFCIGKTWSGLAPKCEPNCSLVCLNQGTCVLKDNKDTCVCPPKVFGKTCKHWTECPALPEFLHGTRFQDNDLVLHSCDDNFHLVGDPVLSCNRILGRWIGSVPTCANKNCPDVPAIAHAEIRIVDTVVNVSCDDGYTLFGTGNLSCDTKTKSFDKPLPACLRINCLEISSKPGMQVSLDDDALTAKFTCHSKYRLVGPSQAVCNTATKTWNSLDTFCQPVACAVPNPVQNGSLRELYKSLEVSCDSNFILDSPKTIFCNEERGWMKPLPICLVSCGLSPSLDHAVMVGQSNLTVSYTCLEGFQMVGGPSAVCVNGTWLNVPYCQPYWGCNFDVTLPNGRSTYLIHKLEFECNPGYRLVGSKDQWCSGNGSFNGTAVSCQEVDCGRPALTQGLMMDISDKVALFACKACYVLVGHDELLCLPSGTWSHNPPQCQKLSCSPPQVPDHGKVVIQECMAVYTCEPGYKLINGPTRSCQSNSSWTGADPYCRKLCLPLKGLENGIVQAEDFSAKFSCYLNYDLVGQSKITCLDTGLWSADMPVCVEHQCPSPIKLPEHLHMNRQGKNIKYNCDHCYYIDGPDEAVCVNGSEWNVSPPKCVHLDCEAPHPVRNGSVKVHDCVATYKCDEGFYFVDTGTRMCQPSKTWDGEIPICAALQCDKKPEIKNGFSDVDFNTARFRCNECFRLEGKDTTLCQDGLQWKLPWPKCINFTCPLAVAEGLVQTNHDCHISFSCAPGYYLFGVSSTTCNSDGIFRDSVPTCQRSLSRVVTEASVGGVLGSLLVIICAIFSWRAYKRRRNVERITLGEYAQVAASDVSTEVLAETDDALLIHA